MDKELFRILQEIKLNINKINMKAIDELISEQNLEEEKQSDLFNYYRRKYILLCRKFHLLNILTFGINYKKNKYSFELEKELLNGAMDKVELDYNMALISIAAYEALKNIAINKLNTLKNNREQIDNFLSLCEKLSDKEKENIMRLGCNYE